MMLLIIGQKRSDISDKEKTLAMIKKEILNFLKECGNEEQPRQKL